jgi:hypothetical protein
MTDVVGRRACAGTDRHGRHGAIDGSFKKGVPVVYGVGVVPLKLTHDLG